MIKVLRCCPCGHVGKAPIVGLKYTHYTGLMVRVSCIECTYDHHIPVKYLRKQYQQAKEIISRGY